MFAGFFAMRTAVRWLPLATAQFFGACLGACAYACLPGYRRTVWKHLRLAFGPRLSTTTCHRIALRVFMNLGKTAMEWFVLDRLTFAQLRRIVEVHGLQHIQQALAKGRGMIAVSAHFGNWEVLPMAFAFLGFQGGILARRLRYPEYQHFLWSMRRRKGITTYDRGSFKDVTRLLRQNQIVGMMPDQDIDSLDGIFVDFFNLPAYTPVGPATLALLTGASIVPCFITRVGRRFRFTLEAPIASDRTTDRATALHALTQQWSRVVESHIRCYPDQWAWMHRRWKTLPGTAPDPTQRQSAVATG